MPYKQIQRQNLLKKPPVLGGCFPQAPPGAIAEFWCGPQIKKPKYNERFAIYTVHNV